MSDRTARDLGTLFAFIVQPHDDEHHAGKPCKALRVEITAFVAHVFKLDPMEVMGDVKERLVEHIRKCDCPESPRMTS